MKKLLLSACLALFAFPVNAANCIALVFHDSGQTPPADLFYQVEPWSDTTAFETNIALFPVPAFHIYYDSFGTQQGPTSYPTWTGDTFVNQYGFRHVVAPESNPALLVKRFLDAASASQRQALADLFEQAGSASEDVTFTRVENSIGPNSSNVLIGSDTSAAGGVSDETVSNRAADLGNQGDVIWNDIIANGCP